MDWESYSGGNYLIAQWLFARGVGLSYFFAFFSLFIQIPGLWGRLGIEPLFLLMDRYRDFLKKRQAWKLPTVFWFSSAEWMIYGVAALGMFASLLVVANVLVLPSLAICYIGYLSFCVLGSRFLTFQWDILLLEVGFAAFFFLWAQPASPLWMLVMWFLLFRFMLSSGLVKLFSKDPRWRDGTALSYHFETQPLPTLFAWYMHRLPASFLKACCWIMFFIEIVAPFGIFAPSCIQFGVFILFALLMGAIALTGNYCFFNLLTVSLSFLLIEDRYLQPLFGEHFIVAQQAVSMGEMTLLLLVGALLGTLNILSLIDFLMPKIIPQHYQEYISPFRICNRYGLFSVMTTVRNEIVIEGSADRQVWKEYEFKWKPGALDRRPRFVAPHQPRLDWQMWFAALSDHKKQAWFMRFMGILLQNNQAVLDLLEHNPFPNKPPAFVRARFYRYRFTDAKTRAETGAWWQREYVGEYTPPIQLGRSEPQK